MSVLRMKPYRDLDDRLARMFGDPDEPMTALDARARELFPGEPVLLWECDAITLQFFYMSEAAVGLLGYPLDRWLDEITFWPECVIYSDDREDAVSYCALSTAKGRDHEFEYRAVAADGRIVWLRDVVKVIRDDQGRVRQLRGAMFDVTGEKASLGLLDAPPRDQQPTRAELLRGLADSPQ